MTERRDFKPERRPMAGARHAQNVGWQYFLEPLVGLGKPVSVADLDFALQELTQRKGDARNEIYAYLRAEQKVGAKRAFWIGEALRDCGIKWSSGIIALAVASHLEELVALLALLTLRTADKEQCAALLAACCAILTCTAPKDVELAMLQHETRERLAANNIAALSEVFEAWEALSRRAGSYGRLFASVMSPLRDAYASARLEDHSRREQRVFEDLGRFAASIADGNARLFAFTQSRFACRSRLDQRKMYSLYADALHKYGRSGGNFDDASFDEILRQKPRTLAQVAREDYGIAVPHDQGKSTNRRKGTKGRKKR
jgi:hypothetical protein